MEDPEMAIVPSRIRRGCPTTGKRKIVRPAAPGLPDIASLHGLRMPSLLATNVGGVQTSVGAAAMALTCEQTVGSGTSRRQTTKPKSRRTRTHKMQHHFPLPPPTQQSVPASIDLFLPGAEAQLGNTVPQASDRKRPCRKDDARVHTSAYIRRGGSRTRMGGCRARPTAMFNNSCGTTHGKSTDVLPPPRLHHQYHHRYGLDSLPRSVPPRPETHPTYVHFVAAPVTQPPSRSLPAGLSLPAPAVAHLPALNLPQGCNECSVVRVGGGYITVGWSDEGSGGRCTNCQATLDYRCVGSPPWFTSNKSAEMPPPGTATPNRQPKKGLYELGVNLGNVAQHEDGCAGYSSGASEENATKNEDLVRDASLPPKRCAAGGDDASARNALPDALDSTNSTDQQSMDIDAFSKRPFLSSSSRQDIGTNLVGASQSRSSPGLNACKNDGTNASTCAKELPLWQGGKHNSLCKSAGAVKGRVAELRRQAPPLQSRPASGSSTRPNSCASSASLSHSDSQPKSDILLNVFAGTTDVDEGCPPPSSLDDSDRVAPVARAAATSLRLRKKMPKARRKMPVIGNRFKGANRDRRGIVSRRHGGGNVGGSSSFNPDGSSGAERGNGSSSSSSSSSSLPRLGSGRSGRPGSNNKSGNAATPPGAGLLDVGILKEQLAVAQVEPAPLKRDSAALDLLERACKTSTSIDSKLRFQKMYKKGSAGKGTLRQYRRAILQEQSAGQAISQEVDYALAVLGIGSEPGAEKSLENFEEFASVVLLVEKIRGLDAFLRQTIQALNPRLFQASFAKAKQLYYCNDPSCQGSIGLEVIELELRAGNVSSQRRENIMHYLGKQGLDELTFLDYLAYLPLFIHIHENVMDNPLAKS